MLAEDDTTKHGQTESLAERVWCNPVIRSNIYAFIPIRDLVTLARTSRQEFKEAVGVIWHGAAGRDDSDQCSSDVHDVGLVEKRLEKVTNAASISRLLIESSQPESSAEELMYKRRYMAYANAVREIARLMFSTQSVIAIRHRFPRLRSIVLNQDTSRGGTAPVPVVLKITFTNDPSSDHIVVSAPEGPWAPDIEGLFACLKAVIPTDWKYTGIASPKLYQTRHQTTAARAIVPQTDVELLRKLAVRIQQIEIASGDDLLARLPGACTTLEAEHFASTDLFCRLTDWPEGGLLKGVQHISTVVAALRAHGVLYGRVDLGITIRDANMRSLVDILRDQPSDFRSCFRLRLSFGWSMWGYVSRDESLFSKVAPVENHFTFRPIRRRQVQVTFRREWRKWRSPSSQIHDLQLNVRHMMRCLARLLDPLGGPDAEYKVRMTDVTHDSQLPSELQTDADNRLRAFGDQCTITLLEEVWAPDAMVRGVQTDEVVGWRRTSQPQAHG